MKSKCDRCGEVVEDIDAGFSPGRHEMRHGHCGGTWRPFDDVDEPPDSERTMRADHDNDEAKDRRLRGDG